MNIRISPSAEPETAFGSKRYAREVREVYDVSQALTTEQKRIADFWADGAGTITPPGHWNAIALDLIRSHRLSDRAAAHLLAALNTAQADAFIACWDAKYTYWSERPVTAIRRELDPAFLSTLQPRRFRPTSRGTRPPPGRPRLFWPHASRTPHESSAPGLTKPLSHASTAASISVATTRRGSHWGRRSDGSP
jgi:hypothetical protein